MATLARNRRERYRIMADATVFAIQDLSHGYGVGPGFGNKDLIVAIVAREPLRMGSVRKPHVRHQLRVFHHDVAVQQRHFFVSRERRPGLDQIAIEGGDPVQFTEPRHGETSQRLICLLQGCITGVGRVVQGVLLRYSAFATHPCRSPVPPPFLRFAGFWLSGRGRERCGDVGFVASGRGRLRLCRPGLTRCDKYRSRNQQRDQSRRRRRQRRIPVKIRLPRSARSASGDRAAPPSPVDILGQRLRVQDSTTKLFQLAAVDVYRNSV